MDRNKKKIAIKIIDLKRKQNLEREQQGMQSENLRSKKKELLDKLKAAKTKEQTRQEQDFIKEAQRFWNLQARSRPPTKPYPDTYEKALEFRKTIKSKKK